jgi:hypothetical protein
MNDFEAIFKRELLEAPTEAMQKYLSHFDKDVEEFIGDLAQAARSWVNYHRQAVATEETHEELVWSAAYFLNAINSILTSTRLFLAGYLIPSGNQVRFSIESLAFAVLLAFPATGTYSEWQEGHNLEHKAVERLGRNAVNCGVTKDSIKTLYEQAKWYDIYSHPSRESLASVWYPRSEGPWMVGGFFAEEHLEKYRQEMAGRISVAKLLINAICGTHARLIDTCILPSERGRLG